MVSDKTLAIGTVSELAEKIAGMVFDVRGNPVWTDEFHGVDFCVLDQDPTEEELADLELLKSGVSGWYGIKAVDTGFDSADLILFADYYGGGGPAFCSIWTDMPDSSTVIRDVILESLNVVEGPVAKDTKLFIEFLT